jgi:hypothetical protein
MPDYRLFGGILRSDLEFPELQTAENERPSWTLDSITGSAPTASGELLGSDVVTTAVRVAFYRRPTGFRMVFDDTGCFDISHDGSTISWYHTGDINVANARLDLTGRVLAAALHAAGTICLHGSAVVLDERAIGFMAPKHHGKSTLALALVSDGARLLTDDTLPVEAGPPPVAHPGLHAARLWPDSAARMSVGDATRADTDEKQLFADLPDAQLSHNPAPLAALYLLVPEKEPNEEGRAAWRTPLSPVQSALMLIGQAKLAPLIGRSETPVLLERAAQLARHVPVYQLHVVRSLDRLADVVSIIRSWHVQLVPSGGS